MNYKNILVEVHDRVGLVILNRPKALNALNEELLDELCVALRAFDADEAIACMVLSGNEKAFAAGADIGAMANYQFIDVYRKEYISCHWEPIKRLRKPLIAAVAGYALGGGCELAMACDILIAAENAQFAQPEVKIGTMPGAGGTQRLPRAISKAKAMDMCLSGRMMDAAEAERAGLVSRVVPLAQLLPTALEVGQTISQYSLPVLMMIKESVNQAYEMPLTESLRFERNLFYATFSLDDQKEGMTAFVEKRKPCFKNK